MYSNHGYSHEALDYIKSFWSMKSDGGRQNHTNLGAASPGTVASVPAAPTAIDPPEQTTVPARIHPRCGDISALRDPRCAELDESFGTLGIWTIAKAVWMAEVCVGMEKLEREREMEDRRKRRGRLIVRMLWDEDTDGDESSDLLTRSTSMSSLSDDSETTLVEDDSPSASFLSPSSLFLDAASDGDEQDADDGIQLVIRGRKFTSQAKHSSHSTLSGLTSIRNQVEASKSQLTAARCCQSEWATDWLSRWEVIGNPSQTQKKSIYDDWSGGYNKLSTTTRATLIADSI